MMVGSALFQWFIFFSSQAFINANELDNQQSSWETFYFYSFQLFDYMLHFKRQVNYSVYLIKSYHQVTDSAHHSGPFCCHLREEEFTWKQSFIRHHYLQQEAWPPTLNKSAGNDSQNPLTQTIDTIFIHYEGKQTFRSVPLISFCYYLWSVSLISFRYYLCLSTFS